MYIKKKEKNTLVLRLLKCYVLNCLLKITEILVFGVKMD